VVHFDDAPEPADGAEQLPVEDDTIRLRTDALVDGSANLLVDEPRDDLALGIDCSAGSRLRRTVAVPAAARASSTHSGGNPSTSFSNDGRSKCRSVSLSVMAAS
jgi:hypothetical protein